MEQARQISLFITIIIWAIIVGGLTYSHTAFYPNYLSHLPESTSMINNIYGLRDDNFWIIIQPITILSIASTFILNWKITERRKYIFITTYIYCLAITATAIYFYPQVIEFSQSNHSNAVSPEEWRKKGQMWYLLSWIRLIFLYIAFVSLLIALTKKNQISE